MVRPIRPPTGDRMYERQSGKSACMDLLISTEVKKSGFHKKLALRLRGMSCFIVDFSFREQSVRAG